MHLSLDGIAHVNSITHEGKVVVVATDFDGNLWYTVRRDGFEASSAAVTAPDRLAETPENWEPFAPVALPNESDDASVVERERPTLNLLRSIYREGSSSVAPVQLVSGMGHLYIFRQSLENTLRVDRFVLDGLNNKLVRKLEVRYTRSKKRYEPEQPSRDGGRIMFDALDFRDRDGNPFYEPTTELALISGLKDGWFSVVLLPTDELDRYRWNLFAYNATTGKVELVSIAASEDGLFDLRDGRATGIVRRRLDLGFSPTGSPAATKYDVQREVQTQAGKQWLRNATRVMLAVPTETSTAVVDFAAAIDGTLSKINRLQRQATTLQGKTKAVLLAPDTLDQIRGFGTLHPAASGTITGLARNEDDQVELKLKREQGEPLASDTQIEIGAGQKIDGTYDAHAVVVGRTLAAMEGTAVDRLQISALSEPLAKGTRLAVNASGSESIVVLSQRADVGVTALQIVEAAVDASANALITLADSPISIGSLAQEIHTTDLKTLPLANGLLRGLDAGARLVVGATARQSTVVTLAADALAGASEIQIEPATLAIPANAALSRMDAFDIDLQRAALGNWKEIKQEEAGLVSDGMVTRITVETGGRLRIHAVNHGLVEGDQVRISGAADYVGTWPVQQIDQDHFQIDARWQGGVATNLRLERTKRRALTFDGDKDYIADSTYRLRDGDATAGRTHELWFRTTQSRCTLLLYEYDLPPNAGDVQSEDALISLSKGASNSWVSAACGLNLINVEMDLTDGQWHHVAHTFGNAARGQSLYVDGKLVAQGITADIPANDYPGTLLIGEALRNEVFVGFRGEIAEVRLWERMRTPAEIAAAMYGPLLGREAGLLRYWPLGAIVEGEPRKVVDLSPSRRDAIVHGDVYAAPVTVRSTLADGITPAIEYRNDSLVAVSAGVRYEESFEFRLKNSAGEVIDSEQQVDGLFKFRYQGKRSHSAEEWITLPDTAGKNGQVAAKTFPFKRLGDGWFKATGEFRLDEDAELTLMRSFGTAEIQSGRFDVLEVRKHGLRAIEAGITEELYEDATGPGVVGAQALRENERRFSDAEAMEPTLVAERNHWQTLIDLNTIKDGAARVTKLQRDIADAKKAWDAAAKEYVDEQKDPTNYWCKITNPSSPYNNKTVSLSSPGTGRLGYPWISNEPRQGDPWKPNSEGWEQTRLWAFIPDGTHFRITTKSHAEHGALCDEVTGASLRDRRTLPASEQSKAKWHKVVVDSSGKVQIKNVSGRILVGRGDNQVTVRLEIKTADEQFAHRDDVDAQRWILQPTTEPATKRFEDARAKSDQAKKHYDYLQGQLNQLQTALAAGAPQIAKWRAYLKSAEDGLALAQGEMQQFGGELLKQSIAPVAMSRFVEDPRGLKTHFANLHFIDAASRITMSETADGNVQLAYFDRDGRMRFTRYDAAASTDNATFEQWLPDSTRTCLEFRGSAALTVSPAIALPAERTIEAWFYAPLPKAVLWNVLAGAADNERAHGHVVVREGELGINLGGRRLFHGCGFNVGALQSGWHHLAAVTRAVEEGATTTFYIDGTRVGDVMEAAVEAMRRNIAADSSLKSEDQALELEQRQKELNGRFFRTHATIDTIGNLSANSEVPFGRIAEFRVWGLALTDEEIEINSKTELSGNEPGLLAWYPLNGDTKDHAGRMPDAVDPGSATSKQVCTAPIGHPGYRVAYFDGSGDALHLPEIALPQVGTIEFWVKTRVVRHAQTDQPDGSTPWQSVFSLTDGKTSLLQLDTCFGYPGLLRAWRFELSAGPNGSPTSKIQPAKIQRRADHARWLHVGVSWDWNARHAVVLLDGERQISIEQAQLALNLASKSLVFGQPTAGSTHFNGWIAEVRLWATRRTENQIKASMSRRVRGNEPGLIGYWPLATANLETTPAAQAVAQDHRRLTPNLTAPTKPATLINANVVTDHSLPFVADGLVTNEYVTYGIDFATGGKIAMLRRFLAAPAGASVALFAQKRVEQLELKWIGNAQFKPTLLGYIEGAPPVPSENLTVDPPSYNGAAAVELEIAEEVRYGWSRETDSGWGVSLSAFIGAEKDFEILGNKVGGFKAGLKGEFAYTKSFLNTTTVDASSTSTTLDRVELRGSPEDTPRFPSIGRRFVPKNIGYALVVSALADVFVTKLKRTGRMVSYALKAVEGIKPDVNTITFLINPAYTMNGSLDGLTGLQPTSERFFADVPQMRAQYGAVYPASYYRLYDAYDRAARIDKADAERATYFANFDAHSVSEGSVALSIDVDEESEEAQKEKAEAEAKKLKASRSQMEKRVHTGEVFESWQRKMEDLQIKAGKRNIVNTYVWDADGGTHAESQQFAATVEHTIGSSVDFNGKVGFDGSYAKFVFKAELTAQATFHLTQTMTKQLGSSRALSLNVDLSGVERQSVTDFKDRPYYPGEKVKRYRFMSFYLEGNTTHFDDFFAQVVDPEWLAGNSEGARALREVDRVKKNKTWRVLHRVTYVERPALAGFGRDTRQTVGPSFFRELGPLQESVERLEAENKAIQGKLDAVLAMLKN